jgi:hypothetical protein
MMEHPFVVFFLILFYNNELEDGKNVNSQLETKVNLERCSMIRGPVGVLSVDLRTRSAPASSSREPILFSEGKVRC